MDNVVEYPVVEKKAGIQRYGLMVDVADVPSGVEDDSGEWVKYDDHIRAMLNPQGIPLCKGMAEFYQLSQFLLDNIADLEQDDYFAGFQMHRIVNDEGVLLQITLTPCDNLDGVTAPRMVNSEAPKVKTKAPRLNLVSHTGGVL